MPTFVGMTKSRRQRIKFNTYSYYNGTTKRTLKKLPATSFLV